MQRAIAVVVCAVALTAARGQETPSLQSGPMMGGAPDASVAMSGEPAGGYRMEPGMTAPKILQAVPAVYPEDASLDGGGRCLLSMVVNRDGMPLFIHVVHSAGEAFDAAAIYAVRQSKFEAGLREQKAVPIRTVVRVTFTADRAAAVPEIVPPVYPEPENAVKADYPPSLLRRMPRTLPKCSSRRWRVMGRRRGWRRVRSRGRASRGACGGR
jgi:TonB family protein